MSNRYGPKLTPRHHELLVIALHSEFPEDMPSAKQELALRKAEFYLNIDFRLGVGFPLRKRWELWDAQERANRHRLWHLFKGLFSKKPSDPTTHALIRECAKVLDDEDLRAYLDLPEDFSYER